MEQIMLKLFGFSRGTYYTWQKNERPALMLLQQYFSEDELLEYLNTGKISKLEELKNNDFQVLMEKNIAYGLQYKFRNDREGSFLNWLSHVAGKKYLKEIVLDIQKGEYSMADTKEKILSQISGMEKTTEFNTLVAKLKKGDLSSYIRRSLSELECYVLVKHYNIVMDHTKYFSKS